MPRRVEYSKSHQKGVLFKELRRKLPHVSPSASRPFRDHYIPSVSHLYPLCGKTLVSDTLAYHLITTLMFTGGCVVKLSFPFSLFTFPFSEGIPTPCRRTNKQRANLLCLLGRSLMLQTQQESCKPFFRFAGFYCLLAATRKSLPHGILWQQYLCIDRTID